MSIEIKTKEIVLPCPFCGSTRINEHKGDYDSKPMWLTCVNCGACGPDVFEVYKDAVKGWNNTVNRVI